MTIAIGLLTITYYSICILLGIIIGYILVLKRRKIYGIKSDDIDNLLILSIPSAVIGARVYHILAEWDYYQNHLSEIVALRLHGMGIFGAVLAAVIVIIIYCKWKKISFRKVLDLGAVGLMLGQVIGRFGNYFNKELYGFPTDLPWKIFIPTENRIPGFEMFEYFHPTFLYESLWNLVGVGLLINLEKKIHPNPPLSLRTGDEEKEGVIFSFYLIWYGVGRFLIGFVRLEPDDFWILNDGQMIAALIVIIGVSLFLLWGRWTRVQREDGKG